VISPRNTKTEIAEKTALHFDAGTREVWICAASGAMKFYARGNSEPVEHSTLCPAFPRQLKRLA